MYYIVQGVQKKGNNNLFLNLYPVYLIAPPPLLNELPPLWLYPMRKFLLLTFFWDTLYLVPDTGQVVRSSTNSQTLGNISSGNNFQLLRSHRRKSALAQLAQ